MKYTLPLLLGCIISLTSSTKIINLNCRTMTGSEVKGAGQISRAKCPNRMELVSCGIDGWHNIGGTRVRPNRDSICEAEISADTTSGQPYGVRAVANCCRFPRAARAEAMTRLSTSGTTVTAECPRPTALTGCTVDYDSGSINNIKGSYAGNNLMTRTERNTRNTCTGQARSGSTNVVAGAQCIKLGNPKYNLECKAVTKYGTRGDMTEANTCPSDMQLLSCMTYTTTLTLDDWHLQGNVGPTCYVQQDNYAPQYANGVCCKLTKTGPRTDDDEDELFEYIISVDQDDEEEGYMFVNGVGPEITSQNSYNITLMACVVLLLVIGYGLYNCCRSKKEGYQKLATNDYGYGSSLTTV